MKKQDSHEPSFPSFAEVSKIHESFQIGRRISIGG
jgi:hypothetical protein